MTMVTNMTKENTPRSSLEFWAAILALPRRASARGAILPPHPADVAQMMRLLHEART